MDDDDELGYSYSMKSEGGAILNQRHYNSNSNSNNNTSNTLASKYLMTSRTLDNYYSNEMKYEMI